MGKRIDTRPLIRLRFIEAMLSVQGYVRPRDVREMFGVKVATSGRDIAQYNKLYPTHMKHIVPEKIWLATLEFKRTPEWWAKPGFFGGFEDPLDFLIMLKRVYGSNIHFNNNLKRPEQINLNL